MKCFDMQMKSAKQFSDELATVKGDTRAENAVRTRRYKAQKALFEGQCAGTPQAARQLALANEKLKELGASASQGSAGNNQGGSAGNSQGGSASSKDEAAAKVQIDRARNAADANARRQAERAAAQSSSGMERTAKQQESDAWLAQQSLTRGTECVTPIKQGLYGAFKNTCDYKVWVEFCAFRPNPKAWSSWTDCEKPKGFSGVVEVKARSIESAHVLGAETIYWVACVYPYTTTQSVFERGRGIKAVCHK